ncbi:GNAT family N-acetyltransferase [Flavobacterium sp. XGLA_31]|uniref:GNAT family N-acetyltransferase n=1 Tax=Flavobacterium sp. XGLA_31 TaxID=3447666 RepID=UPI003F384C1E
MSENKFVYQLAKPTDVEQIVSLFERCLGSDGGAPTTEFWNWKHHQNPADVSPVVLAWDGDKLIGIRAFMCFKFQGKDGMYKAYRPVDTATHPDYQGKGIFRNLTLSLIEDLKTTDEKAFIFNTPNSQSKPGYLKMGWIEWGKPLLQVLPAFPFSKNSFDLDHSRLRVYDFSKIKPIATNHLAVYKDSDYYKWRYQQIALQSYGLKEIQSGDDQYVIIYRQKNIRFLKEFRICDVIKNNSSCSGIPVSVFVKLFFAFGFGFISFIDKTQIWLSIKLKKNAPMVTFRKINDHDDTLRFQEIDWNIGELELF